MIYYGARKVTADGFRWLVNQHFANDPDTLAISPPAAAELQQDLASRGLLWPVSSIEGCTLAIDEGLRAGGWELRNGSDVIAAGYAK
jgi:hypothetical protein